jgi:hypothetical protein
MALKIQGKKEKKLSFLPFWPVAATQQGLAAPSCQHLPLSPIPLAQLFSSRVSRKAGRPSKPRRRFPSPSVWLTTGTLSQSH